MINGCSIRRTRWWGGSAGLAGGALVTAAMVGIVATHTEGPTPAGLAPAPARLVTAPVDLTAIPAELLSDTITDLHDANQALSQIDLHSAGDLASFITTQISSQGSDLAFLDTLQSAENLISSNDAPLNGLVDLWFTVVNFGWELESEAVLGLDKALGDALASTSTSALPLATVDSIGLIAMDLGLFGQAFGSFPITFASLFF